MADAIPSSIKIHKASRELELWYGETPYRLSFEFLRVHSPSAEVQGHGSPILQIGKQDVSVYGLEPVGNYGVKIVFDDGHDSGIYSWATLTRFCLERETLWANYLSELDAAGIQREP